MNLSCQSVPNAAPIEIVSASATFGIGLITGFAYSLSNIFGKECKMYAKKVTKATDSATKKLVKAATKLNAAGIMDVRYEVHGTSVFVYGMAYAATATAPAAAAPAAPAPAAPAPAPAPAPAEAAPADWFCKNCGTQNAPAANFCKGCGQHK